MSSAGLKESDIDQPPVTMLPAAFLDLQHGSLDSGHFPVNVCHGSVDTLHGPVDTLHGPVDERRGSGSVTGSVTMEDTMRYQLDRLACKRADSGRSDDVMVSMYV